jgi:hypothetical protein
MTLAVRSALLVVSFTFLAGCSLLGPAVTCPDPADLSQADCDHAVRIATRALPLEQRRLSFARIVVRHDFCTHGRPCPSTIANMALVTFYRKDEAPLPVSVTIQPWHAHFIGSPSPAPLQ